MENQQSGSKQTRTWRVFFLFLLFVLFCFSLVWCGFAGWRATPIQCKKEERKREVDKKNKKK
jgi:hypothetical protein